MEEVVKKTKFISLMSDGSTDSAVMEEEIIYVRTCDKGVPQINFVGVATVPKADAAHIFTGINSAMNKLLRSKESGPDWSKKLVAFGSDGAAVMTGTKNGVVAKFKEKVGQHVIGIHCINVWHIDLS